MASDRARPLGVQIDDLVRAQHEAFLRDAFGMQPEEPTKLPPPRPVLPDIAGEPTDPLILIRQIGREVQQAPPNQQVEMRDWSLDRWVEHFTAQAAALVEVPPPGAPPPPPPPPAGGEPPEPPGPPEWLSPSELAAYQAARTRAGDFARGLGNAVTDDILDTLAEVWDGAGIVEEVDAEKRDERREIIRQLTGEAIAQGWDYRKLATELGAATEDWSHGWERIARTELQGAYNEGRVFDAVQAYGAGAQVARVPESGACEHCEALFRGDDGNPIVWPVEVITGNGTNVGRDRKDWRATIWPVHPHCRCDTVAVPPGMIVLSDGRLRVKTG